jgi:hypothetical protein
MAKQISVDFEKTSYASLRDSGWRVFTTPSRIEFYDLSDREGFQCLIKWLDAIDASIFI